MRELPEALVQAEQLQAAVIGRTVKNAVANASLHGFAWYHGDPAGYTGMLEGKTISEVRTFGSFVEMQLGNTGLSLCEGASLRLFPKEAKPPDRHQLYMLLDDGSFLISTVSMYGGIFCYEMGAMDGKFYLSAQNSLSPFSDDFDLPHFLSLIPEQPRAMSVKALLATEQRIAGFGNGVLQDVLWHARMHPRLKIATFNEADCQRLFKVLKETLLAMYQGGGRDVEKDLHGQEGGYRTILSAKTVGKPCPACGSIILREAFLGGNIYYCPSCQPKP